MQKAVFFDRDGVVNCDEGLYYVYKKEDFRINPGVLEFMKNVNARGYIVIIISNQGGIARGKYTKEDTDAVHIHFLDICSKAEVNVTEIYYCPHHPDYGDCICRKPGTLMLEKALARFEIDNKKSYLIGDRETDAETAIRAGITPLIIKPNSNLMDYISCIVF